ncbi:MAG: hypothetical protein AB7E55_36650 [Pigmentiphaga sp.]
MPNCTVTRTHERGRKLDLRRAEPIPGPVTFDTIALAELNRQVACLRILRGEFHDGRERPDALPPLCEPQLLTFSSDFGMMFSGFEQIDGQRYYQGWYIQWVDDRVRTNQTGEKPSRLSGNATLESSGDP